MKLIKENLRVRRDVDARQWVLERLELPEATWRKIAESSSLTLVMRWADIESVLQDALVALDKAGASIFGLYGASVFGLSSDEDAPDLLDALDNHDVKAAREILELHLEWKTPQVEKYLELLETRVCAMCGELRAECPCREAES